MLNQSLLYAKLQFPGGSVVKNLLANAGDVVLILGAGSSPGEGNGQCTCLESPIDKGACRATVHGVTEESDTTPRLNNNSWLTVLC